MYCMHSTVLYCTVLYFQYCTVLRSAVCTALYCTAPYCMCNIVLHPSTQYFSVTTMQSPHSHHTGLVNFSGCQLTATTFRVSNFPRRSLYLHTASLLLSIASNPCLLSSFLYYLLSIMSTVCLLPSIIYTVCLISTICLLFSVISTVSLLHSIISPVCFLLSVISPAFLLSIWMSPLPPAYFIIPSNSPPCLNTISG